jgi:uncharacterized membrane protein YbhN (UPF0104 family)
MQDTRGTRRRPRLGRIGAFVLAAAVVVALVWRKLPAVRHAGGQLAHLPPPSWPWIAVAAVAVGLSYVASAAALAVAVGEWLPLGRSVLVQLSAATANRFTPASVGGAAVSMRFLTRRGFSVGVAGAAVGVVGLAHVTVAVLGVAVFGPAAAARTLHRWLSGLSAGWLLLGVVGAVAGLALGWWVLRQRSVWRLAVLRVGPVLKEAVAGARRLSRHPRRLAGLLGLVAVVKAANLLALYAALWSFDGDVAAWRVAVAYLVGATTAEAVPTPGGLGTVDAALLVALVGAGTGGGAALAGVIVYRLLAFWAPIVPGGISTAVLRRRLVL